MPPIGAVTVDDQSFIEKVGRAAARECLRDGGRGGGDDVIPKQEFRRASGPGAAAVTDRYVGLTRVQANDAMIRDDVDDPFPHARLDQSKMWHQPKARDRGKRGDADRSARALGAEFAAQCRKRPKRSLGAAKKDLALRRQSYSASESLEDGRPQPMLDMLDTPADRSVGYTELGRRSGHRPGPRGFNDSNDGVGGGDINHD